LRIALVGTSPQIELIEGGFAYFDTLAKASVIFEAIEAPAQRRPPQAIWLP
jgi:hypothetical protein